MAEHLPANVAMSLHHVGIVVGDLDTAVRHYTAFGMTSTERFTIADQAIEAVTFQLGTGWIELLQPTDPDGPIARYHAKRGDGVHHIGYQVEDIDQTLHQLAAHGVRLIDSTPRPGAHGWRIAFIHPESCAGVLTELVQVDVS
jgi:methylmalonyl-CoA/ethylmalonyl-CoA epimerase